MLQAPSTSGVPPARPRPARGEGGADTGVAPPQLTGRAAGAAHPRRVADCVVPQIAAPVRRRAHGAGAGVS
jgi:hypothetical protein